MGTMRAVLRRDSAPRPRCRVFMGFPVSEPSLACSGDVQQPAGITIGNPSEISDHSGPAIFLSIKA